MPVCNNCHQSFEGKYCSHCGQKGSVGRLTMHEIYHELVHSFTHTEKGVLKLSRDILFAPRKLYRSYFSGKRKTYFSPVTFFLLGMGLLIFLGGQLLNWDTHQTGNSNDVERILFQFQKIRYLIFIPVISLLTWALFHKTHNLAECFAFWFFCIGAIILIELISFIPQFAWVDQRHMIRYITDWLIWFFILFHLFLVFGDRGFWAILKCIFLGLSTYFVLVYIYKLLGYWQGFNADFNFWNIIKAVFQ
ncbi:MAG: DUF3667 domain-containing protein [Chitinophagaceae bacterium]|nr:DUF3667 domain-containing protein [Chitinophagaceae bacterium]